MRTPGLRRAIVQGIGIRIGFALYRLLCLVLGLGLMGATGLVLLGDWPHAIEVMLILGILWWGFWRLLGRRG